MYGTSLFDHGESYTEDMLFVELHERIPLNNRVLISHRLRPEVRWVGLDPKFSYRFRYRLMVEKEFKTETLSLIPYINVEPYWDSRYDTFNRVRVIGGATASWAAWFALEGNLTYQYDSKLAFAHIYAINGILHLYF